MYNQIDSNKRRSAVLIIIFILIMIALGLIFGYLTGFLYEFIFLALIISIAMTLFSYFRGDKLALWSAGAKGPIAKEDNPYVWRLVENLSITAGVPMPKIYIINDPAPNAFATGRDPETAAIAVSAGIINMLENEELEGVIAHELSHIKNYDVRLMMIVLVLAGTVALMANWFLRFGSFGGRNRDRNDQTGAALAIVGLIMALVSPIIAEVIKLAVSRRREYLADASGALLTRYPEGLARALEKISAYDRPMIKASNATAHLFFVNPYFHSRRFMSKLFSTHPPIEDRINRLRGMERNY
ncbi:MAG: M48 family metallopeptidase [Patescibacteria group bacterium]